MWRVCSASKEILDEVWSVERNECQRGERVQVVRAQELVGQDDSEQQGAAVF